MLKLDEPDSGRLERRGPDEHEGQTLRVDRIVKDYDEFRAVDNVSFELKPGTFYALLGPSGCGKTTLLKTLAGLESPTSGQIYLGGKEITSTPPYRRPLNTVFQQYALFPHMNVGRNIGYSLRQRRPKIPTAQIEERVEQMLDLVQMRRFKSRRPWELSGGQQQRVALARALLADPQVLLLDESLSALDAKLRREMQRELKAIQQRLGISFIFVTHDQSEALYMADRIAVMRGGKIVQDATPLALYDNPVDTWVGSFIGSINYFRGVVQAGTRDLVSVATDIGTLTGRPTRPLEPGQQVSVGVRPERMKIVHVKPSDGRDFYIPGHLLSTEFRGDQMDYTVQVDGCGTLRVREPLSMATGRQPDGPGTQVFVTWDPSGARVIPQWQETDQKED